MSDNLFDDYNYENEIRSLEDLEKTIAFHKEEIQKLREDLENNGDNYSAENYEMTENAIYAIETVMEKYQEELEKGRFEESQEHNFKIEKTMQKIICFSTYCRIDNSMSIFNLFVKPMFYEYLLHLLYNIYNKCNKYCRFNCRCA